MTRDLALFGASSAAAGVVAALIGARANVQSPNWVARTCLNICPFVRRLAWWSRTQEERANQSATWQEYFVSTWLVMLLVVMFVLVFVLDF
jgi:hypothetical protein